MKIGRFTGEEWMRSIPKTRSMKYIINDLSKLQGELQDLDNITFNMKVAIKQQQIAERLLEHIRELEWNQNRPRHR